MECSGFKYYSCGRIGDFAVFSAHNARESYSLVVIGYNEHGGVKCVRNAVEGNELFAVLRASYVDFGAAQTLVVERVHGLTVLEHNIVCDINDVVYRTNAFGAELHSHPQRRRSNLDVLYHPCAVAVTFFGVLYVYREIILYVVAVA